jgi:hypothetical protein
MFVTADLKAVSYEHLPNKPDIRGFYYWFDMADYEHLFLSNMPYQVMQGYIVLDSVIRATPSITYLYNPIKELKGINPLSDTGQYVYKYWYLMDEYDPLRYLAFFQRKYSDAKNRPTRIRSELEAKVRYNVPLDVSVKPVYAASSYILHIRVNNIDLIDTADTDSPEFSESTVYCKILDTLKGGAFPSLNNAIFWNGELVDSHSSNSNNVQKKSYVTPQQTDIVFSFLNPYFRNDFEMVMYTNGDKWIKPYREYIVFLVVFGPYGGSKKDNVHKVYYSIRPYPLQGGSRSMYPIEDGFVIDKENELGFGIKLPIEEFKQNIINKINEIKNYGEF